jgi:hypothetical protein
MNEMVNFEIINLIKGLIEEKKLKFRVILTKKKKRIKGPVTKMKEVLEFGGLINSIKGLIKEEKKEF